MFIYMSFVFISSMMLFHSKLCNFTMSNENLITTQRRRLWDGTKQISDHSSNSQMIVISFHRTVSKIQKLMLLASKKKFFHGGKNKRPYYWRKMHEEKCSMDIMLQRYKVEKHRSDDTGRWNEPRRNVAVMTQSPRPPIAPLFQIQQHPFFSLPHQISTTTTATIIIIITSSSPPTFTFPSTNSADLFLTFTIRFCMYFL